MLKTTCQAQYLTGDVPQMRGQDYDSTHLVKAVKGLELHGNSYTDVMIDGKTKRIVNANKDDAIEWFAEWAAKKIIELGSGPFVLVPIPSSKTVADSPEDFRTLKLAEAIARRVPGSVAVSTLRFKTARPSSREEGGSRDPKVLYPNMTLTKDLPAGEVILIDDVMTSGGHFIAASWMLEDKGRQASLAIACGRSLSSRIDDPFSVPAEEIDISR